jgi:chaperone required for assembly of F1-ATPase
LYGITTVKAGYAIERNGIGMKTPMGVLMLLPSMDMAEAVVSEWRSQTEKINPALMPITQLAATALDITGKNRKRIIDECLSYAGSELLCHRAELPEALVERQIKIWQPLLDDCARRTGAVLSVQEGIQPIRQPQASLDAFQAAISACSDFELTGLRQAIDVSGSIVLGLAMLDQVLSALQVFEAAELDAIFQMEKWGHDPATLARHEGIKKELEICEKWFAHLKDKKA